MLTIVLCTYNRVEILKKTLPIYLNNKNKKLKFLILNNNSSDKTKHYINKISKLDKRITIINNKKNIGPVKNYLKGLKLSKSKYTGFLADDDIMHGTYLDSCIDLLKKHKNVGLICNGCNKFEKKKFDIYKKSFSSKTETFRYATAQPGIIFQTSLANKKKFIINNKSIYSHVNMILDISNKTDLAVSRNIGLIPKKKKNGIVYNLKNQNRPNDYGFNEINFYAKTNSKNFIQHHLMLFKKIGWFLNIANNFPEKNYKSFVSANLNGIFSELPVLTFLLLCKRFDKKLLNIFLKSFLSLKSYVFLIIDLILMLDKLIKNLNFYKR
tara:strand:+ start:1026 stop:2000 length:975 start_codon:yes stop_codon:yes gene_type:complete